MLRRLYADWIFKKIIERKPTHQFVREIGLEFRQLMKAKQGNQLQTWCNKALNSAVESLKGFIMRIKQTGGVPHFKAIPSPPNEAMDRLKGCRSGKWLKNIKRSSTDERVLICFAKESYWWESPNFTKCDDVPLSRHFTDRHRMSY